MKNSSQTTYIIYALIDPRNDYVFYVGCTENIYTRFLDHLKCNHGSMEKNNIIMKLRLENRLPILRELQRVSSREESLRQENYWIEHFQMLGQPIKNIYKNFPSQLEIYVLDLCSKGMSYRTIAKSLGLTFYQVQKFCKNQSNKSESQPKPIILRS